jgi:hypothetical protein
VILLNCVCILPIPVSRMAIMLVSLMKSTGTELGFFYIPETLENVQNFFLNSCNAYRKKAPSTSPVDTKLVRGTQNHTDAITLIFPQRYEMRDFKLQIRQCRIVS